MLKLMSEIYIPLYRKYRPQTLDMLVGQEHIKKTLTSAIELGKISHAYLFTGPRGTGKTSTARIFAKSLNCTNGPTIKPCGKCESCKNITDSIPIDVIEIDAASNRKVEDAQNLLEKVQYLPVHGKYKIYIIDEVHMLSNHAFNALLKTLEEPPENVIFILATTEVYKVLDTIKSRCQRFDFRRITTADITKHLRFIADSEKINITDDALLTIAKNSAGGMRDSISLLDQLSILGYSKQIDVDDVNAILGRISFEILYKLTNKIICSNSAEAMELINDIYNSGNEPLQILTNLSEYLKNLLIVKTCSGELLTELTGLNELQIKEQEKQGKELEAQQIIFLIDKVSYYIKEIKFAINQHLWLEVGIIDISNMTENSTLLDLQKRISALENGGLVRETSTINNVKPISVTQVKSQAQIKEIPPTVNNVSEQNLKTEVVKADNIDFTPPPMSKKSTGDDISSLWNALLANINSPSTSALLKQLAKPIQIKPDEIIIGFKNERNVAQMNEANKKTLIKNAADILFNNQDTLITIKCLSDSEIKQATENMPVLEKKTLDEQITKKEHSVLSAETPVESTDKVVSEPTKKQAEPRSKTDQEKMILDLFDGKYVN